MYIIALARVHYVSSRDSNPVPCDLQSVDYSASQKQLYTFEMAAE